MKGPTSGNIYADVLDWTLRWFHSNKVDVETLPLGEERKKASHRWAVEASKELDDMNKKYTHQNSNA